MCSHTPTCVSSYYCIFVVIMSSYSHIYVLILLHRCAGRSGATCWSLYMCPHTTICVRILLHVSSYSCIFILILLYSCAGRTEATCWSPTLPPTASRPSRYIRVVSDLILLAHTPTYIYIYIYEDTYSSMRTHMYAPHIYMFISREP